MSPVRSQPSSVNDSAARLTPVIDALGARSPDWVRGYRTRIVDGNHLSKTERRLKVLRPLWTAALPGKVLAVYEPAVDLVTHVCLTPDGHAQERALFDDVLALVRRRDLWIADRNFCTRNLLFGLAARQAAFVLPQHANLPVRLLGKRRYRGRTATGRVHEQAMELEYEGQTLRVRRVTVVLDQPTTDGDTEIHLVTNLPEKKADAVAIAELYRKRWTLEGVFQDLTVSLQCEINTLGYPGAALLGYAIALVIYNVLSIVKTTIRVVHGAEAAQQVSTYYFDDEISSTWKGIDIFLPTEAWNKRFGHCGASTLAKQLRTMATGMRISRYRKHPRGPKKPPPKRSGKSPHVSTARLISKRKK